MPWLFQNYYSGADDFIFVRYFPHSFDRSGPKVDMPLKVPYDSQLRLLVGNSDWQHTFCKTQVFVAVENPYIFI